MSYMHFAHAKEIKRVLTASADGLTRSQLFDALAIPEKDDRVFGETLAELCQGPRREVVMVREPGTFTIYKLRANYSEDLLPSSPKRPPPSNTPTRPRPMVRKPLASKRPSVRCKCGGELPYTGKGRPPTQCKNCKTKQIRRCPICGHRLKDAA